MSNLGAATDERAAYIQDRLRAISQTLKSIVRKLKTRLVDHLWVEHGCFRYLKYLVGESVVITAFSQRETADSVVSRYAVVEAVPGNECVIRVNRVINARTEICKASWHQKPFAQLDEVQRRIQDRRANDFVVISLVAIDFEEE